MSKVTTLYEDLIAKMVSLYPDHKRLHNPYSVSENNERFLQKGWGIQVLSGNNSQRQVSCQLSVERDFGIVLSRKWFSMEQRTAQKETAEKALLEDQFLLLDAFSGAADQISDAIVRSQFVSDSGILFVTGEKDNFIHVVTLVRIEYFENLN